jgi:two-component system CheB/CheR fusion protein
LKKLKYISKNLSDSEIEEQKLHFSKELTMFRMLLLTTMIAYPLLGYIRTFIEHVESNTILFQRVFFSGLILISLLASYKIQTIRDNFYTVMRFFVYIGFSHLVYIALLYGWSFSHTLGIIIVLLGTSFVFRKINQLGFYLIYSAILVTVITLFAPKNELENAIVLSLFYALCFIIFTTIKIRLKSQKTIKGNEATISAIIENAEGLVWSIDTNFNYIAFNRAFQNFIIRLSDQKINIGDSSRNILADKNIFNLFEDAYQKVFNGENVHFKSEVKFYNEEKYYSFYLSPIKIEYSKIIGVTVFGTDVTLEKKQEFELVKAKEFAEELTKSKQYFLSNMSHEIRTPLNGIIGFTSLLLKSGKFSNNELKQLMAIKNSSDILIVIINDILDLSKMEAGKMTFESIKISLTDLIQQSIETFNVKSLEKNITIKTDLFNDTDQHFIGDPIRISQILLNIISNAIKFTSENGTITIGNKIISSTENTTIIQFTIEDSGIGIEKEKLELIFQPFVQTDENTTRKFGGTGLGLSIVKKIIELMNGSISVESIYGEGTKFIFQIPLKTNKEHEQNSITEDVKAISNFNPSAIKILLAEDNLINQILAQTVLGQFGFQIKTVENGKLAVEAMEQENFDLILMDLMMPEMNGYEATQLIRNFNDEIKRNIPIIALTADVTTINSEKCNEFGMNDYISKPFDSQNLYNKIAILINNQ